MKKDLVNQHFGEWTVLSYAYKKNYRDYWHCKCSCGNEKDVQQRCLLNGDSTSCGCSNKEKIKDLTGEVFGRLTVISFAYSYNNRAYWNCQCSCGNKVVANSHNLVNGNTKSCGCLHSGNCESRKDITGQKFNHLTVIRYLGTQKSHSMLECLCDCGKICIKERSSLVSGMIKSCGCRHYPESDTDELAYKFHKHKSTVILAKKELFGKYIPVLSETQVKEMEIYFKKKKVITSSKAEKEVVSFVKSIYKGEVIENDRSLIAPKELDIYIPEKNFAIEYDGLARHSERTGCKSSYHLQKTRACNGKGVRLFHLYSNEWRDKKEIVKSMISSALGVYERKIYARKCDVREVTDRTAVKDMLNGNHLQGDCGRFSRAMGLYYKGELVQLCVFGTQHFGRKDTVELYRMVTLKNTQVVGGFSRLMEHSGYSEVMSYVSLRTFNASGYYSSGWTLESMSQPSYCYTDGFDTYSRQLFKKDKCLKRFDNVTEDMTETEMTEKNGFYKLWDCGTYKVSWKKELKNKSI